MIKSISVVIDASSLYEDTTGLDVAASTARFAELVRADVEANYPGVDIDVSVVPVALTDKIVVEYDDEYGSVAINDDMPTAEIYSVEQTLSAVFTDGAWVVEA